MNKRGIYRIGLIGIFIVAFVLIFALVFASVFIFLWQGSSGNLCLS